MKTLDTITRWLFIVCLPFALVTGTIAWAFNSGWLYQHGFQKNRVDLTTGLDETALNTVARGLISYFNSPDEYIELTVIKDGRPFEIFNAREIEHLKDVKVLVWLSYRVLLGTGTYVLAYVINVVFIRRRQYRSLAGALVTGAVLTFAMMLALGVGIVTGFDRLFLQFHLFSFANDLWQLDPARDYLIMLVPRDFWYDTFLIGAGVTAAGAAVLGGAGAGYLLSARRREAADRNRADEDSRS